MALPVVLAWSGGKDSSLALAVLQADTSVEVVALVTTVTAEYDRISMHGVRRSILEAQVAEVGLLLVEATIPAAASNEIYEEALAAALDTLRVVRPDLRHLAFGDLFLTDVRAYRERLLEPLGWSPIFRYGDGTRLSLPASSLTRATGPSSPAWTPPSSAPSSPAASSILRCWLSCLRRSTHAASAASSTPAYTMARFSCDPCHSSGGSEFGARAGSSTVISHCSAPMSLQRSCRSHAHTALLGINHSLLPM